jgi:hypothetical protein
MFFFRVSRRLNPVRETRSTIGALVLFDLLLQILLAQLFNLTLQFFERLTTSHLFEVGAGMLAVKIRPKSPF